MSSIKIVAKGDFKRTFKFLDKLVNRKFLKKLDYYGRKGVDALADATPKDSGLTASSWGYQIIEERGRCSLVWTNSNINDGVPIAVILQYGHGTNHGGYVKGRDYINPVLRPIFDEIAESAWKEVTSS